MKAFAVFRGKSLIYVGLHDTEDDCWRIYLGWPTPSEVEDAKRRGFRVERVSVTRIARELQHPWQSSAEVATP